MCIFTLRRWLEMMCTLTWVQFWTELVREKPLTLGKIETRWETRWSWLFSERLPLLTLTSATSTSTHPHPTCPRQAVPDELDETLLQKCFGLVEVVDLRSHLLALALAVGLSDAQSAGQLLAELLCDRVGFLCPEGWKCREVQYTHWAQGQKILEEAGFKTYLVAASVSRSISLSNCRMVASAWVMWASFSAVSCMNCSTAALIG